jgi:hypothetical protein
MARRSNASTARRLGLLGVAAALAGALAAAGARRGRREDRSAAVETTYSCDCGAVYRVSGTDRHRVYWPAEASASDPVLGDRCIRCDAPLPVGHDTAVAGTAPR